MFQFAMWCARVTVWVNDSAAGKLGGRRVGSVAKNQAMPVAKPADESEQAVRSGSHKRPR
jgi:hypothetical protein